MERTPYHSDVSDAEWKINGLTILVNCTVKPFEFAFDFDRQVSRPQEFHPKPLLKPDGNLSAHPASTDHYHY